MAFPAPGGPAGTAPARSRTSIGLREYVVLVGVGAFVTTFAQSRVLGQLPTTFLLKDHFRLTKEQVALFFFWATFAWNLKPLAGILTDAFPLFGTRRRHYMMLGSVAAGVLWLLMGMASDRVSTLLAFTIAMNVATVFASTVMGGLMVEAGQAFGATGRVSSLRQLVESVASIAAPVIGGYLAAKAYGWTTALAAVASLSLAVCVFFELKEQPVARPATTASSRDVARPRPSRALFAWPAGVAVAALLLLRVPELSSIAYSLFALALVLGFVVGTAVAPTANVVVVRAQVQLGQIVESRTLWMAVGMLFLVYTVPGLNTALVYQQSDVLHFGKGLIGLLGSLEGIFGVVAAGFYAVFCRKLNLRVLLVGSIAVNALATFLFLVYSGTTAPYVHAVTGLVGVLSELALMDLAVRSTPSGCEALGFSLMMSVRNFGIAISDVIGAQLMDQFHVSFSALVVTNALTTLAVLLFVPMLPALVMSQREGEAAA